MTKLEIDAAIAEISKLTPKQQSRALATLVGKSPSEIARHEGVSKQAVAETLQAPIVQSTLRDIISRAQVQDRDEPEKRFIPIVNLAIRTLVEQLYAEKAASSLGVSHMVADNDARYRASCRILDMYEPSARAETASRRTDNSEYSVVQKTTRRVIARRSGGPVEP